MRYYSLVRQPHPHTTMFAFSPSATEMHSFAAEYDAHMDAMRDASIEAQEQDEEWLESWQRPDYEENRVCRKEYLQDR